MNKKVVIGLIVVLLIAVIIVAVVFGMSKKNTENGEDTNTENVSNEAISNETPSIVENDFLEKMKDVSYVKLSYSRSEKELDNELAEIISTIDTDDIKDENYYNEDTELTTGEQEYIFRLYDENDELLYQIQYKRSDKRTMLLEVPIGHASIYYIINKDVEEYIDNQLEMFH